MHCPDQPRACQSVPVQPCPGAPAGVEVELASRACGKLRVWGGRRPSFSPSSPKGLRQADSPHSRGDRPRRPELQSLGPCGAGLGSGAGSHSLAGALRPARGPAPGAPLTRHLGSPPSPGVPETPSEAGSWCTSPSSTGRRRRPGRRCVHWMCRDQARKGAAAAALITQGPRGDGDARALPPARPGGPGGACAAGAAPRPGPAGRTQVQTGPGTRRLPGQAWDTQGADRSGELLFPASAF